jgi:Xaa-Pro aminopeptidase
MQRKQLPFLNRIKTVQKNLKGGTALISAAPETIRSADQYYPYRQDSDFFYLTGSHEPDQALFICDKSNKQILLGKKKSALKKLWDGSGETLKQRAQIIGIEYFEVENLLTAAIELTKRADSFFYQSREHTISFKIFEQFTRASSVQRKPTSFCSIESVIHPMRLIKDPFEIYAIQTAADITMHAIIGSLDTIQAGNSELVVAKTVEYWFGVMEARQGFGTIAASGKNAATLHYHQLTSKLKTGDTFLLDCGAEYQGYNGDISRTFPVGGKFIGASADVYDIVLASQKKALSKVKDGVKIKSIYDAAAMLMIEGLKDLKILKGTARSLFAKNSHKPYFPHGIGHSLGIDVHDVGGHRGNNDAVLKSGMVFTIEPGLYFSKSVKNIPAMGVRIEDDILVTKTGYKNLTEALPKERKHIENIILG